jgi:hypothetical protein
MSTAEIIAQLEHLSPHELAQVQAKLDQLAQDEWLDGSDLSDSDKQSLNTAIATYEASPEAGCSWDDVKARIEAKLRP